MYYTYVLSSEVYDRIYIDLSVNPQRRLYEHNAGQVRSTKRYKPFKIIKLEKHLTRKEARAREKKLKQGYMREKFKK